MNAIELGRTLVNMANDGEAQAFAERYYSPDIVSIEGAGSEEMPARSEGLDALHAKGEAWFDAHEVHGLTAEGPFVGLREDLFAVRFRVDVTPKGGTRTLMEEIALYTVSDQRIAQEEFLYLTT